MSSSIPSARPAEAPRIYGGTFDPHDRNNPRTIIGNWTPAGSRVLEVGPGSGVISRWLRAARGCHVVGVEVVPEAAEAARDAVDFLIVGSIEDAVVAGACAARGPYDAIIFADVLEHLVDPWSILRQARGWLAPGGRVLTSFPNIAHWTARLNLVLGRFDYTDGYLMDRTHLRWFTWKTARELARGCGYRIATEACVFKPRFARFAPTFNGFQIVLNLAPATEAGPS
jgi:2-polyprenyl-3-methyl-5-hydroxy-6-metoxy-1,4-benzoquinol methylase